MTRGESRVREIRVGMGTCGVASGARDIHRAVVDVLARRGNGVPVRVVGCNGLCHLEPLVEVVYASGRTRLLTKLSPGRMGRVLRRYVPAGGIGGRLRDAFGAVVDRVLLDEAWQTPSDGQAESEPYLAPQRRIVLEQCGQVDPLDMDAALAAGAYSALRDVLERGSNPALLIDTVEASGLRGRGGAGYPTGLKWRAAAGQASAEKYVICNADEGDPGAFMDRLILESDPHRVLEGLALAAYAIGASQGYVYVRAEYPLAVEILGRSIAAAEQGGYLGQDILGSGFSFQVKLVPGAGAFVCGEETALIASIEGRRGMPSVRPPYPTERGLWGKPTCINNVETLACVPWILRHGAEAFAAIGTKSSRGTKVFALAGRIRRGGLIEVPMGMTLGEIVEQVGGGVGRDRKLKAIQIGGPSGGCIPAEMADLPVDYEALNRTGAIMGSGGLVVLDDSDCMVDVARYFLEFTEHESCGQCTPCRVGTRRMREILERLCGGHGQSGDLDELEHLAHQVQEASLCGLGRTAPNPVLTTLRYFREEYLAHLEGRCPAKKCMSLIHYRVTDDCIGCTRCAQRCPTRAIEANPYQRHEIQDELCVRCGTCLDACPAEAIVVE